MNLKIENDNQTEPKRKLITFYLDNTLRSRIDDYCKESQLSLAQFFRLAAIEKIEQPKIAITESNHNVDTSSIEYALDHLQQQQQKMTQMMEFLIDQQQQHEATQDDIIASAKALLLEHQPKTYKAAAQLIPDINTMNEAINQLLQEQQVHYKRRQLIWL
ncbi:MAG: hypothetical protein ACFE9L_04065 [Candidatus Hodarchaeota archaeon]